MQRITFLYKTYEAGIIRPTIEVDLTYGSKTESVYALVDSGSESTFFNPDIAELLGIKSIRSSDRCIRTRGLGDGEIDVYYHEMQIGLPGLKTVTTLIGLAEKRFSDQYSGILGQQGFFDDYSITFEYPVQITIEARPQPLGD